MTWRGRPRAERSRRSAAEAADASRQTPPRRYEPAARPLRSRLRMSTHARTAAPLSSARGADASLNILVVDDESDLREMLTRSFSREGHRVTSVADGRAAIDRASSEHFDVVLLDIALGPGPDGYEVCRTLRARRNVVPIIMLTALDSE